MSKENKVTLSFLILVFGFFASTVYHYVQGAYLHRGYPYSTPLFIPDDHFADFKGMRAFNEKLDPYHSNWRGYGNNYPPGAYLVVLPFTQAPEKVGILVSAAIFLIGLWFFVSYGLGKIETPISKKALVFALSFFSYPTLFSIDRLNTEAILTLIIFFAVLEALKGKERFASALIGIAAAAKIYPALMLFMLPKKKWAPNFVVFFISFTVFTGLALLIFRTTPSEVLETFHSSYSKFHEMVFIRSEAIEHGSSIYGAIRTIVGASSHAWRTEALNVNLCYVSYAISIPLLINSIRVFLFKKLQLWERLFVPASLIILVPQTSFDYKLPYLYPAFLFFLSAPKASQDKLLVWLFSLMFVAKNYGVAFDRVTWQAVLNPVILIVILLIVFRRAENAGYPQSLPLN